MAAMSSGGNIFYMYSDILEVICEKYLDQKFSFKNLHETNPEYDRSLHKKFVHLHYIILTETTTEYINKPNNTKTLSTIKVRYYTFSASLKHWYIKNYVTCTGKGVIAKKNRELRLTTS